MSSVKYIMIALLVFGFTVQRGYSSRDTTHQCLSEKERGRMNELIFLADEADAIKSKSDAANQPGIVSLNEDIKPLYIRTNHHNIVDLILEDKKSKTHRTSSGYYLIYPVRKKK